MGEGKAVEKDNGKDEWKVGGGGGGKENRNMAGEG